MGKSSFYGERAMELAQATDQMPYLSGLYVKHLNLEFDKFEVSVVENSDLVRRNHVSSQAYIF